MASYAMHLAIAKTYLKEHNENEQEFYEATVDVDNVPNKKITHYSLNTNETNAKKWLGTKVGIEKYVENNKIETSYDRGFFLHLLVDYYFYNCFFNNIMLENMSKEEFLKQLYQDYDILNSYLIKKYDIKIPEKLDQKYFEFHDGELQIMTYESVDEYIEFISKIDIDQVYKKIKNSEDILYFYKRKEK